MNALEATCPPEYDVTQAVEIRISSRRSLTPDVLVVTAEAARRNPSHFQPDEVVLAIEIVSPGSKIMDRITKPAMFAEAGIPLYWRIETEPQITVHTGSLDIADVYRPTGTFTDTIILDEPWRMKLPISTFTPRRLD
jgi:Uma2 family endonuclease